MGVNVSIDNQTPYTWHYATQTTKSSGYKFVQAGCSTNYQEEQAIHRYIYFRYENNTYDSFKYEFNTYKGATAFILKVTPDRSQIELYCTSEGIAQYCPNYGKN